VPVTGKLGVTLVESCDDVVGVAAVPEVGVVPRVVVVEEALVVEGAAVELVDVVIPSEVGEVDDDPAGAVVGADVMLDGGVADVVGPALVAVVLEASTLLDAVAYWLVLG
jgi:hypothetical protein